MLVNYWKNQFIDWQMDYKWENLQFWRREESKEKQKNGAGKEQAEPSAGRDGWQEAKDTPFR